MQSVDVSGLAHVMAEMSYTKPVKGPANVLVFPPSSGRKIETPQRERVSVPVYDCRPIMDELTLDEAGFQVLFQRFLVRQQPVQRAIKSIIIDFVRRHVKQICQRAALVQMLGDTQLAGWITQQT